MKENRESEKKKKKKYPEIVLFRVVSQRPCTTSWPPCPDPLTSGIGKTKLRALARRQSGRSYTHRRSLVAHPSYSLELVVFAKVILKFFS